MYPHSTTKETLSMLFMRRKLCSRLDLLKLNITYKMEKAQKTQCARPEIHAKARLFKVDDKVLVREEGSEHWEWCQPRLVVCHTQSYIILDHQNTGNAMLTRCWQDMRSWIFQPAEKLHLLRLQWTNLCWRTQLSNLLRILLLNP